MWGGAHSPSRRSFAYIFVPKPKPQELRRIDSRSAARDTREKRALRGQESANSGGGIDAIVIELDIISIIITIIFIIITAISTAAPRHRCNDLDIDVVIRLANRETISPIGIVRDVEVLCDCKKEKIVTKFAGESYEFNFSKFAKTPYKADLPNDDFRVEQCASIALAPSNPLQQHLENSESEVFREERDELDEIFLRQPILKHDLPVEDLGVTPPPKEDPVFDLKPLPDNLKYAYIDDKKTYPVIISAKLSDIEEERLENIAYDPVPVNDSFPNEQLAVIKVSSRDSPCTMASNNKDKEPWEEEMDEGVNKGVKKIASAKREREAMETIRVTDEFCDQYRALRREVEILQEENQRLRRMLEYYSIPITRSPPPHLDDNESLRVLVQNCQTEKLKLKEICKKREKNSPPSSPKE
ncbi:hypothetical protein QYE76_030456 [Lolium multiflorum]|uniref:Uncharacterized protein n=1 Tax=Lolium multiflorum TaxID=4521 RepID=A0AAD8VJB8_LOLMU|nr:hypothetical protein QYE76_030456 [Lolium multiflorum]